MYKVENFRLFNLYNRSLDLTKVIYDVTHKADGFLTDSEVKIIREKVVIITRKIASGISQVNLSYRFKLLNEAKATLNQLKFIMDSNKTRKKIDLDSLQIFEKYRIEIISLLKGYLGWNSSKK